MEEPPQIAAKTRFVWPWIALAGVAAATALAVLWMSAAVKRTRDGRPPGAFHPASNTLETTSATASGTNDPLAGFRGLLQGGNALAGRKIFFEKPEANCAKCHKADSQGGDTGPPLDGIGATQSREYLLESMIRPNCRTMEGYETVILILKNGSGCSGFLKSENESELTIQTPENGLITVNKAEVQIRQKGLSPMPEGLTQLLSRQDLSDLVEFLASLKTPARPRPAGDRPLGD